MHRERPGRPRVRPNRAGNSDALENLARIGLIAYGVVHLLVAWLALQLAWFGGGGKSADQSGAMSTRRGIPGRQAPAVADRHRPDRAGRVAGRRGAALAQRLVGLGQDPHEGAAASPANALVKAAIYIALAVLAIRFATGSGQSSSQKQQDTTAGVLGWPAGQFLVGAAGLILIGSGVWHVRKGAEEELPQADRHLRGLAEGAAPGHPARAGRLPRARASRSRWSAACSCYAAVTFDPSKAKGLDGALHTVARAARSGRSCSPRSPSASPRSARSSSSGPATPTATRRPEVRPSGRRRRR